jgi:hypothetical protein
LSTIIREHRDTTVSTMAPPSKSNVGQPSAQGASERGRIYRDLRDRAERQQRRRRQVIERLVQQQRERRIRSFRRASR